ncbi:MAG: ATP-binding protein [Elusimicrobia bacterium]|nr:ATP-binding protein [Elusimicrobiota bacterium]
MKPRTLAKTLQSAVKTFPAVVVTGPRQSGKTTLLKALFSKTHKFISLEDPSTRIRAKEDPVGFLEENSSPIIIDEIQYVPELLSYIKTLIDQDRKPGQWLFTGSQNFSLMHGVSQSLAGRVAVLTLLPFSFSERIGRGEETQQPDLLLKNLRCHQVFKNKLSISYVILRGSYPEITTKKNIDRQLWCGSYISTYLERDVRNLANIGDLNQFQRFLKICATRTGQILNLSAIASEIGISVVTAKRWISILEAGHQVFLLYPYYKNIGKRLIKSPKLYFNDTAIASYLLGLHTNETLIQSPSFGNLFETFIITDFLKRFLHSGQSPSLYYLRTKDGMEIDLVIECAQKLYLFEIKSGMTIYPQHALSLVRIKNELGNFVKGTSIISRSFQDFNIKKGVMNYSWSNILSI